MRDYGYSEEGHQGSLSDFGLWKRVLRFSAPYKAGLIAAVFISFIITASTLTLPHLVQTAIDSYITVEHLERALRMAGLSHIALQYGLLVVAVFFATFIQILILEWVGQSVMHTVRQRLFTTILNLDLTFFNSNPTGRLVTRLTNDIQNMNEMFTSVIVTLFNDLLRLAGILLLLFYMNPRLAGVMTLFMPVALVITIIFAKFARERFREIRTKLAKINSYLSETLAGISILQIFNRQAECKETFESLTGEYLQKTLKQIKLFGTFMPLTEFLSSAAVALILWYGGGEILQKRLTLGELVAFISYMRLFFQPLRELSQKYSVVQSAMASAERIFQLLDKKSAIQETPLATELHNPEGRLDFQNIHFSYTPDSQILSDVSFSLEPGQTVALVGTTGSGKTTLVNLLLRFYEPQHGNILIDGHNIKDLSLKNLRQVVGVILQDVFLLQDTLLANIVMETGCNRQKVEEILKQTGIDRFTNKLPQGLDTLIGEGGMTLSTGEKQLLAFARVLCRDPAILILDEATAAIDTESENILETAIADSFKNRTSLVIAHRLSTIRRANHIVVMRQGKIVESGTHDELLAQNGHYALLVAMDLENDQSTNDVTAPAVETLR
ncbi:ABC transporter ATP-binding protein [Desulforhopalus sp. IMCC35007]|uniref:ABC transporter ATP-binding protein n=1 Tax=Desulforhopalus sp. IMCC35007 TaxID=2569543 RepID=UPI0010AE879A|nr:ABC transporter ATP-binding protein [Desulforhopalus sp. IMCC35007]TKB08157.1 ABC transporter ATP-binding protein [Desulforhopalus sp. IMCC35007]